MPPRFFVEPQDIQEQIAFLQQEDRVHAVSVLRLRVGDTVIICDGQENEYDGQISKIDKNCVGVSLNQSRLCRAEPRVQITLFQGLPKLDKLEWVVQKCTEAGVAEIIPIQMKRSVARISQKDAERKQIRLQKIAREAAMQSGRGRIPMVQEVKTPEGAMTDMQKQDVLLVLWEEEKQSGLKSVLRALNDVQKIGIVIGPEGGITVEEVEKMTAVGGQKVSMGKRILRCETAGLVAISAIMYEYGELGEARCEQ